MSIMSTTSNSSTTLTNHPSSIHSVKCEVVPPGKLKVLVITGASNGIGLAIARRFITNKK